MKSFFNGVMARSIKQEEKQRIVALGYVTEKQMEGLGQKYLTLVNSLKNTTSQLELVVNRLAILDGNEQYRKSFGK